MDVQIWVNSKLFPYRVDSFYKGTKIAQINQLKYQTIISRIEQLKDHSPSSSVLPIIQQFLDKSTGDK